MLLLCAHAVSPSHEEIGVPAFMVAWFRGRTDLSQESVSVRLFRDLAEVAIKGLGAPELSAAFTATSSHGEEPHRGGDGEATSTTPDVRIDRTIGIELTDTTGDALPLSASEPGHLLDPDGSIRPVVTCEGLPNGRNGGPSLPHAHIVNLERADTVGHAHPFCASEPGPLQEPDGSVRSNRACGGVPCF